MNIFVLHSNPYLAAEMHCDKHCVKMVLELYQQLGSAVRRHGASDEDMPLTSRGTPLKGGYHNHPCTKWVGNCRENFDWAFTHAMALAEEYSYRYGKEHACLSGIKKLARLSHLIPNNSRLQQFVMAMPDEYKQGDPVEAYRDYYWLEKRFKFNMKWTRRSPPYWWKERVLYETGCIHQ